MVFIKEEGGNNIGKELPTSAYPRTFCTAYYDFQDMNHFNSSLTTCSFIHNNLTPTLAFCQTHSIKQKPSVPFSQASAN